MMLRFRARVQPDDRAFVFLRDGERESDAVSYAELDRRSRTIAAELQRRVPPGARALLVYPPGLEFVAAFFGCLYARVVAVPVFPPRWRAPDRNLARAVSVVEDARPAIALSMSGTAERWARAVAAGSRRRSGVPPARGRPAPRQQLGWLPMRWTSGPSRPGATPRRRRTRWRFSSTRRARPTCRGA